jgi:lipopolysaccharide export system permease protein
MGAGPGTGFKDEKEMTLRELQEYINHPDVKKDYRYYSILIEFHRKFSMPFACFALGIMALPLGIQSKTSRRSLGLLLGLFLFLFYYLMLSAAIVTGEAGLCPPAIGLWVPNIVTLLIGIYLLIRTVNGRPLYVEEFLPQWMRRWQKH